jgi:hypothetical protein
MTYTETGKFDDEIELQRALKSELLLLQAKVTGLREALRVRTKWSCENTLAERRIFEGSIVRVNFKDGPKECFVAGIDASHQMPWKAEIHFRFRLKSGQKAAYVGSVVSLDPFDKAGYITLIESRPRAAKKKTRAKSAKATPT